MSSSLQGHRRIDRRSLEMHRHIAAKLQANPELMQIARDNLDRWSATAGRSQPYLDAWREILNRPLAEVLALIEEDSERMDAMRQNTPFAGVLEPAERWAIYEQFAKSRAQERRVPPLFAEDRFQNGQTQQPGHFRHPGSG